MTIAQKGSRFEVFAEGEIAILANLPGIHQVGTAEAAHAQVRRNYLPHMFPCLIP